MKIHNGIIYAAVTALNELVNQDWPVKHSLAIVSLSSSLKAPFDCIEKVRSGSVEKYEEEPGKGMSKTNPNWSKFENDYIELMQEKSEVEFEKITLPLVVNGKDVMIKPITLDILKDFIEFKGE